MRRKWMLGLLSTVTLVLAPVAAIADDEATPPASSGAVAVDLGGAVVVSQTSTSSGDGAADATVVEVFGETVVGGSQQGSGSQSGEVISTGETGAGSATVGGWSADVDDQGNSDASASVLHVNIGGESGGDIEVLGSRSRAENDRSQASSYGVHAWGQGHELYLLRSDADTDGSATTALIDIDGNVLVPNETVREICGLAPAQLLSVACVYAEVATVDQDGDGVPDGTDATAGVVDGDVLGSLPIGVVLAQGDVVSGSDDTVTPAPAPQDPPAAPASPDGPLPVSGGPIAALLAAALTALGAGDALRRRGR